MCCIVLQTNKVNTTNINNEILVVTFAQIKRGESHKMLMFVDRYDTDIACWGSEAKRCMDNAEDFVRGNYTHLFWDHMKIA